MKGDIWKNKEDSQFIRQVSYFLRNLQVECAKFDAALWLNDCLLASKPGGKALNIERVRVDSNGFQFKFKNRWFFTCDQCGDILEERGACWRCNPAQYAAEVEEDEKKPYHTNIGGCPNYPD